MSLRELIRDQIITELNTDTPTGLPQATKRRYVPGAHLREPQIGVFFVEEPAERVGGRGGALTKRNLTIAVQCVIPCEDPAEADDLLEPLLVHVIDKLGDTNLDGLVTDCVEVGTQWGTDTSTGIVVHMGLNRWRVEYQSVKDDLSRKQ